MIFFRLEYFLFVHSLLDEFHEKNNSAFQRFVVTLFFFFSFILILLKYGIPEINLSQRHCLLSLKKNDISSLDLASVLEILCNLRGGGGLDTLYFFLQ